MTFRWAIVENQLERPFGRIALENPKAPGDDDRSRDHLDRRSASRRRPTAASSRWSSRTTPGVRTEERMVQIEPGPAARGDSGRGPRADGVRAAVAGRQAVSGRTERSGAVREVLPARPDRARRHGRGLSRRGRRSSTRRLLAVKVMRPQLAREARFVDMFHREGKLAMLLRNRCIVETRRDRPARRPPLHRDGVHRRPRPDAGAAPLPGDAAAHPGAARRVHRRADRRGPALRAHARRRRRAGRSTSSTATSRRRTCGCRYDGDVKLLDFGIAQALMKFTSEIGILKGKFSYMSPGADPRHAARRAHRRVLGRHHPPRDADDREAVPRRHRVRADGEGAQGRGAAAVELQPPRHAGARRDQPQGARARRRRSLPDRRAARGRPRRADRAAIASIRRSCGSSCASCSARSTRRSSRRRRSRSRPSPARSR